MCRGAHCASAIIIYDCNTSLKYISVYVEKFVITPQQYTHDSYIAGRRRTRNARPYSHLPHSIYSTVYVRTRGTVLCHGSKGDSSFLTYIMTKTMVNSGRAMRAPTTQSFHFVYYFKLNILPVPGSKYTIQYPNPPYLGLLPSD